MTRSVIDFLRIESPSSEVSADQAEEATPTQYVPDPKAPPLSYEGFQAGNILSDQQFFDADSYTEDQIASFITKWNEGCKTGLDGTPCLADYTEDAPSFEPDEYCPGGFQGQPGDSAARILWRASQGCGINPQVLLTILQKEQGLITASGVRLTQTRYSIAMGYACPDGTACDPTYFGFAAQVYYAARQMRVYEHNPGEYMSRAQETIDIPFSPRPECESAPVFVENLATSNLYNYTPYQPDAAALGGGEGRCSSWGNLNFYAFFNAWFGTPELALESAG